MKDNDWQRIENQKTALLKSIVDDLSEAEFTILQDTLEMEQDNRHLKKPHGIKERILQTVERVVS